MKLIFLTLALVLFGLAAFPYTVVEPWPWRERLIAAGLFFATLSVYPLPL